MAETKVTPLEIFNPYKFSVYRNAALNTANGAFAIVTFDTKLFDTGSNYSTSTGMFTAPVSGFYQFSWQLGTSSTTTRMLASIAKNSTTTESNRGSDIQVGTAQVAGSSGSALLQMTAGDTANILSFANGITNLAVGTQNQCYFTGYLVSLL